MQIPNPSALLGNAALFEFEIQGVPGLSRVVRFSGHEGISALFEFHLELAGADIDLRQIIGKPATLTIEGVELPRYLHGIISHVQYSGHSRRYTLYELTLVPPLWKLLHRTNCRVFQPATTPAILRKVFADAGLDLKAIRFDLDAAYGERNYCVQYCESDFAFVSRLMEEDGIFYFFTHDEDETTLVLSDHPGVHKPIPGIPLLWFNEGSQVREREHITHMRFAETIRPGKISLRDFNFLTPDDPLDVNADAEHDVDLEDYGYPGGFQYSGYGPPHLGSSMAKIRLESVQVAKRQGTGGSDCPRLTPGFTFTLSGHKKRPDLNAAYLLTRVVHHGSQPQVLDEDGQGGFHYANDFTCIEDGVPFRPPRITPRPVVRGVQSAQVVGPDSEEIHTDDQGRVKVQFHWDRDGEFNEDSSCWVRVSQLWAGAGWGSMFIPRIGHEVLIDFIEGDPDRPIITGRVYHGKNDLPYPLPDEKTKSTIKSNSSLGGGGFNEFRFEDRKGQEEIFLHAQKDWNTFVLNNFCETVGASRTSSIGGCESVSVGVARMLNVATVDAATVGVEHSVTMAPPPPLVLKFPAIPFLPPIPPIELPLPPTKFSLHKDHLVTLTTGGLATITLDKEDIKLDALANISLKAVGNITIEATGKVTITGATVSVTGTSGVDVTADAGDIELQGKPKVKINC